MSRQHGNLPVPERPAGGGRNRKPHPFRLWYRVTYKTWPECRFSQYTIKAGSYRSEREREAVMDKVTREMRWRGGHPKVEFFFTEPA